MEEENRKQVQSKREVSADSLQKYQLQILELENNIDLAGELGPLQYLSGLTGAPMDKIINILLLVIIFVFDPLAIALVIASNFAFDRAYPKHKEKVLVDSDLDEIEDVTSPLEKEFNILDTNQDGIVDKEEIISAHQKISKLKNTLTQPLSGWRRNKIINEINLLQSLLDSEEDVKTY